MNPKEAVARNIVPFSLETAPDPVVSKLIESWEAQVAALIKSAGGEPKAGMLDHDAIRFAWNHLACMKKDGRFMVVAGGEMRHFSRADFVRHAFYEAFKAPTTPAFHAAVADAAKDLPEKDRPDFKKQAAALSLNPLIEKAIFYRQIDRINASVDPYSESANMEVVGDVATVTLPLRAIKAPKVSKATRERVLSDFRKHFPAFDDFLSMVCHARFANDRREAFVWLRAESDFGKGLLVEAFRKLGLIVELTVPMINRIIAGETVGVDPIECLHAWILTVDEWKGASRELKQLNTRMSITAKYLNRVDVLLFTKLFTSAESVASLVDSGIEEQFNNRFSYINAAGNINIRPEYQEIGKSDYIDALSAHIADTIAAFVAEAKREGKRSAGMRADKWLATHREAHQLKTEFGSLDDTSKQTAGELVALLKKFADASSKPNHEPFRFSQETGFPMDMVNMLTRNLKTGWTGVRVEGGGEGKAPALFLSNPAQFVNAYLKVTLSPSESAKLGYKAGEIVNLMRSPTIVLDSRRRARDYGYGTHPQERASQTGSLAVLR